LISGSISLDFGYLQVPSPSGEPQHVLGVRRFTASSKARELGARKRVARALQPIAGAPVAEIEVSGAWRAGLSSVASM
jgi:hypothetical protein